MNHDVKPLIDWICISSGLAAFFKAIPWPEIAGFLSSVWLLTRLYEYLARKWRGEKEKID